MSIARKAARGGIWLAGFRLIAQVVSWTATVIIARILTPEDYGLMEMASLLTGYAVVFSELGLGEAIVQRKTVTDTELSTIFWFSIFTGTIFSIITFGLAYPTAMIFDEPKVIPITQLISVLFIINAVMTVPQNILMRELRFKEIGVIQLIAVIISCLLMLVMATNSFGVWTLILGVIFLRLIIAILTCITARWKPAFYFNFKEVKPFLKYGVNIVGARSFFYLFRKSDKLIVGKMLGTQLLGIYSFALQLASIPTDKIVSIIQQVAFPVFSKHQHEVEKLQGLYLKATRHILFIVSPLFLGGAFFGDTIIRVVLGEKWISIILIFRGLCLTQFVTSLTILNEIIHNAQGRPNWGMKFQFVNISIMPVAIFIATKYGLNTILIPWLCIYPLICFGWTWITLKKIKLRVKMYVLNLFTPLLATFCMICGVLLVQKLLISLVSFKLNLTTLLMQNILTGVFIYSAFIWFFAKNDLNEIMALRKAEPSANQ